MEIFYTKHVIDKLTVNEVIKFRINKSKISQTIRKPITKLLTDEVMLAVGPLDKTHSLVVVYKKEKKRIKVITFFPAKKGRYESKIL